MKVYKYVLDIKKQIFISYSIVGRAPIILLVSFVGLMWVSNVKPEEAPDSYPEIGLTLSGIVHPSVGYWWGRKGVRLSGMYLDEERNEFHLNIGYALSDEENVQHSVNLLTSWVVGNDLGADYEYAATGIAYGLNYKGLFVELGLGWPWKDAIGNVSDNFVPVGYLGYIHRFKNK